MSKPPPYTVSHYQLLTKGEHKVLQMTYPNIAVDVPTDLEFSEISIILPEKIAVTLEELDKIRERTNSSQFRGKFIGIECYHKHSDTENHKRDGTFSYGTKSKHYAEIWTIIKAIRANDIDWQEYRIMAYHRLTDENKCVIL